MVILGCIFCFLRGMHRGAVALFGACLLVLTGCMTIKEAFSGVSWETAFTIAGSLGFAQGIASSGAGYRITDAILNICGPLGQSPFAMCFVMLFLSTLLSNFMSNAATVTVLFPIALGLAQSLHADAMAFALACGIGANMSIATPVCTAAVTFTVTAGYRAKDYVRIGGILNLLMLLADGFALYFVYFL